jgi:molybdate transport system substrate-binding protein
LSQVMKDGKVPHGSAWMVPAAMHQPIRQDAVLLAGARGNAAARALLEHLKGADARKVMRSFGYAF